MTNMALAPIIVPAAIKQTATIIFLHGLGDSGVAWSEILPSLRPPYAKLICPNAPLRPITINGGANMPGWFDLRPLDQPKDVEGIKQSSLQVQSLVQTEVDAGISPSRIVLGGFSQGGALALYTGLTGSFQYSGILALSTWLPISKNITWDKIHKTKILQCHGEEDNMVSIDRAESTARLLESNVPGYKFKAYPGLDHTINSREELSDIKEFLHEVLQQVPVSSKL